MASRRCYGCGGPAYADDNVPAEAAVWCAECAAADVPVTIEAMEDELSHGDEP